MGLFGKVCDAADWFDSATSAVITSSLRELPRFHRKQWEFARIFLALRHLGVLDRGGVGLSLGAGLERLMYALVPHVRHLFAADLYGPDSEWPDSRCTDPNAFVRNGAPFDVDAARLTGLRMDMRALEFGEGVLDFCYSSCAVEHIGDLDEVLRHLHEVRRVLKDGGVYVFTTEFHFGEEVIQHPHDYVFPSAALRDLVAASGLTPVSAVDARVQPHAANQPLPVNLGAFAFGRDAVLPPWLTHGPTHIQLIRGRHPFTSVLLVLRKDAPDRCRVPLEFKGLEGSYAFLAGGVAALRALLDRHPVALDPYALVPRRGPAGSAPQAAVMGCADDTVFHTDYVWLGHGVRTVTVDFFRAGTGGREAGAVEIRVHRSPTLAGAPVECVLSERLEVGRAGSHDVATIEVDDDSCYAVLAKARAGDVRFERVAVAVSPLPAARVIGDDACASSRPAAAAEGVPG